ncbi:TetR family transcriptional regulator [Crenalkalicoccus roseus]|uniref:TetR family transcriptional regulator n=1 Tax=Crenalkalicoccus roseus TaxID=1485588 RepID=UPI001080EE9E|nr:TetR family transcriptional regulator [Crenalkalicoccus roseus]
MDETPTDPETRLVAALWQVVAAHGWEGLTMRRVAAAAAMPLEELRQRCPGRLDLLRLHGMVMDRAVLAGTVPDQGGSARDRIFDAVMRRIDAMQPHRAGILRLFEDLRRDPLLALMLLAELPRSMAWTLEAAEVETGGPAGLLRAKGLGAVWLATLRTWSRDDSADLGATMAALDRALDRAEQVARSLRLPAAD